MVVVGAVDVEIDAKWLVVVVAVEEHVEWREKGASMAPVWTKREKL